MDIFLAILPAIFWGSIVLFNVKLGGDRIVKRSEQRLEHLFSIVVYIFMKPVLTPTVIGVGVVSGLFWALGQANQLKSIDLMGVSRTMPISTGLQLVATTLFGVIVFHEWSTTISVVLGILALVCIIIGVILTSLQSEEEKECRASSKL